jgi:hypothetical protein
MGLLEAALLATSIMAAAGQHRTADDVLRSMSRLHGEPVLWTPRLVGLYLRDVGLPTAATAAQEQGVTGDLLAAWTDAAALAIQSPADSVRVRLALAALSSDMVEGILNSRRSSCTTSCFCYY